jgi:glutamine synthetase
MLLPAALRHLALLREAEARMLIGETETLIDEFATKIKALETANLADNQPDDEAAEWAGYMLNTVIPAMDAVRGVADQLEKVVADDLWPLPKYSEILFIK